MFSGTENLASSMLLLCEFAFILWKFKSFLESWNFILHSLSWELLLLLKNPDAIYLIIYKLVESATDMLSPRWLQSHWRVWLLFPLIFGMFMKSFNEPQLVESSSSKMLVSVLMLWLRLIVCLCTAVKFSFILNVQKYYRQAFLRN